MIYQYIKTEGRRLLHTFPVFLLSLLGTLLFAAVLFLLARRFLPEALEVKPFRVALCAEGTDRMSEYVRRYVQQMESTEGLIEFVEMSRAEAEESLDNGALTACIIIPARTAQSIMDGSNIPIQVLMGTDAADTERYLQKKLLTGLTECGAVLIDVPQAETCLLYEMQVENAGEIGQILDFFHFGLVLDRERWFERQEVSAFGSAEAWEYYLAAGMTLLLLFWGVGSGGFLKEEDRSLPVLLERRGIPAAVQEAVKEFLFFLPYLLALAGILCYGKNIAAAGPLVLLCAMLSLQCCFFFQLAPTLSSGMFLYIVWALAGFFASGGILPSVFLPRPLADAAEKFPQGICMKLLLQVSTGKSRTESGETALCVLWCLFFGIGSQIIFCRETWSMKRK